MNNTINQDNLNATLRMLDKMGESNVEQVKGTSPEQAVQLEQLGTLMKQEDFCKQFLACADKQTAVQLFADHGLTLTEGDVDVLVTQIQAITQKLLDNDGILSEEDLEQIAGGANLVGGIFGFIGGAIVGFNVGGMLGSIFPGVGNVIGMVVGTVAGGVAGALGLGLSFD